MSIEILTIINPGDIVNFELVLHTGETVRKQGCVTNMKPSSSDEVVVLDGDGHFRQVKLSEIISKEA